MRENFYRQSYRQQWELGFRRKGGYETKETYSKQCGVLIIDANGLKGPNQLGADAYSFIITNKKIANWHTQIDSAIIDENLNYIDYSAGGDFN